MRIIGGQFKGRRIQVAKGTVSRPTLDRNREALFNILSHRDDVDLRGAKVIDLFAGSGALGLEAISRGAEYCLFVEVDAGARGAIRENIEILELYGQTRLHRRSATHLGDLPASAGGPFQIAFLDPPYEKGLVEPTLGSLQNGGWLLPGAIVSVEQAKGEAVIVMEDFEQCDHRIYGGTQITIYTYQA